MKNIMHISKIIFKTIFIIIICAMLVIFGYFRFNIKDIGEAIIKSTNLPIQYGTKAADPGYSDAESKIQYLYKAGNEYNAITGGWKEDWLNGVNCQTTRNAKYLEISSKNNGGNNWSYKAFRTTNKINLADYDAITIVFDNVKMTQNNGGYQFDITSSPNADYTAPFYGYWFKMGDFSKNKPNGKEYTYGNGSMISGNLLDKENTITMNVSDVNESKYIYFSMSQGTGGESCMRVKEVYLSKKGSYVEVNPNGGNWNGKTSVQTFYKYIVAGQTASLDLEIPVKNGYTFTGWTIQGYEEVLDGLTVLGEPKGSLKYEVGDASGSMNDNKYNIIYNYEVNSRDILTANWIPNKYNLIVDPSGGEWNNTKEIVTLRRRCRI